MMAAPLEIFEELRFVWELMGAQLVFLLPFAQRKKQFALRLCLGGILLSGLSIVHFPLKQMNIILPQPLFFILIGGSYVCLALLTSLCMRACFILTVSDVLYIGTLGYSVQHIVYVIVHEFLAMAVWPSLTEHLGLYALAALLGCVTTYFIASRFFVRQLRLCEGLIYSDSPTVIANHAALLAVLTLCTMACQMIFEHSSEYWEWGGIVGLMLSVIIISLQHTALTGVRLGRERSVIEQTLRSSASQYSLSKELIDHLNRTCHDLKHNLQVLKTIDEGQRQGYIEETERSIRLYHELVHTEDEVLNTILAEKSLYCDHHQIKLTCAIDAVSPVIDHISIPDLYALLGNAIDNAIECVDQFEDVEKRVVSLAIRRQNAFLCIQTNNYCEDVPTQEDGLPVTTKADKSSHGFGLKSIRYLAQKYGGTMFVTVRDHVFILQVTLPISADSA